jgi:hypothetical protein
MEGRMRARRRSLQGTGLIERRCGETAQKAQRKNSGLDNRMIFEIREMILKTAVET